MLLMQSHQRINLRFLGGRKMNKEMKMGMVIAYQSVKEEMNTIKAELERKNVDEPKGFSVLEGFVEDRMKELN